MPPNDTSSLPPIVATQTDASTEHLTVLADALRDDDEHYEDPQLTDAG